MARPNKTRWSPDMAAPRYAEPKKVANPTKLNRMVKEIDVLTGDMEEILERAHEARNSYTIGSQEHRYLNAMISRLSKATTQLTALLQKPIKGQGRPSSDADVAP